MRLQSYIYCDTSVQVWFASGNISGQFSKISAFEGQYLSIPFLLLPGNPTAYVFHPAFAQMMTKTTRTAKTTMMSSGIVAAALMRVSKCDAHVQGLLSPPIHPHTCIPIIRRFRTSEFAVFLFQ
jgi:hypothetical protein